MLGFPAISRLGVVTQSEIGPLGGVVHRGGASLVARRGRCVLDMLRRADSPMMAREIAAELALRYQIRATR